MTHDRSTVDYLKDALAYVDSWLEYRVWKLRAPGAQVAVYFDGGVQFSRAYGKANLETGEDLTPQHLFRVASHSKTYTATAAMRLVEAGKIRLDDRAGDLIPALAGADSPLAKVTLRELLSHSAGVIRDGIDANYWAHSRPFPDEAELLAIAIDEGVVRPAQASFKYTNIGYSLAGLMLGAAAGTTYNDLLIEDVVQRLGLNNTGPEYVEARADAYAAGHTGINSIETRRVIPHVDTRAMAAATGFYSTAEDMVTFASAHFYGDDRLLSDRSKAEMQRPIWTEITPGVPNDAYGLGVYTAKYDNHIVWGHSGGYPGHITRTFWDPNEGIAISVLTNAVDGPAEELAGGIIRILDRARKLPGSRSLESGLANSLALPTESNDEIDKATFTGRFAALWGVTDVVLLGDSLIATSPVAPVPVAYTNELTVIDANTLRIQSGIGYGSVGETVRYERDTDGSIISVTFGGMTMYPIDRWREQNG